MSTLTCACVLLCASLALAATVPVYLESQPGLYQPALIEAEPIQHAELEESLEPQESAWGGRRFGGFGGGFGGYRHGYGGGGGFGGGGIIAGGFIGGGYRRGYGR